MMLVFNDQVLYAEGSLRKFIGSTIKEDILSPDPNYMADILLTVPAFATTDGTPSKPQSEEDHRHEPPQDAFRVTSDGGFWEAILSEEDGTWIGERFYHPVYNSQDVRIGTVGGYAFNYPATNPTPSVSDQAIGNRKFYLQGGTLDVLNDAIVAASGTYSKYSGGTLKETIITSRYPFVSQIILVEETKDDTTSGGTLREPNSYLSRLVLIGVAIVPVYAAWMSP